MGMYRSSLPLGRRLLLAGFGGLLVLMLVAGIDSLITLRQVNVNAAAVRNGYLHRSQSLDAIRSGIYQSAIVLRDYLLASDPDSARE
jgi:CHASE3 domain sensor protein